MISFLYSRVSHAIVKELSFVTHSGYPIQEEESHSSEELQCKENSIMALALSEELLSLRDQELPRGLRLFAYTTW